MPSTLLLAPELPLPPQFLRPFHGPATSSVPFITLYNFSPPFVNEKNRQGKNLFHSLIRNIVKTNYFSFSIKERRNVKSSSGAISFFSIFILLSILLMQIFATITLKIAHCACRAVREKYPQFMRYSNQQSRD